MQPPPPLPESDLDNLTLLHTIANLESIMTTRNQLICSTNQLLFNDNVRKKVVVGNGSKDGNESKHKTRVAIVPEKIGCVYTPQGDCVHAGIIVDPRFACFHFMLK